MAMTRRNVLSALAALPFVLSASARAATTRPWDEKAFRAAQAAGKPVLVDIYADW